VPELILTLLPLAVASAVLMGAGIVAVGPKSWVFAIAAIAAIGESGPGTGPAIASFLVFVLWFLVMALDGLSVT
jgi:hypothetical protein